MMGKITIPIRSWNGGRDDVGRPHGRGTLVGGNGDRVLCRLEHGVINGSSWWLCKDGERALTFDAQGDMYGYSVFTGLGGIMIEHHPNEESDPGVEISTVFLRYIRFICI